MAGVGLGLLGGLIPPIGREGDDPESVLLHWRPLRWMPQHDRPMPLGMDVHRIHVDVLRRGVGADCLLLGLHNTGLLHLQPSEWAPC